VKPALALIALAVILVAATSTAWNWPTVMRATPGGAVIQLSLTGMALAGYTFVVFVFGLACAPTPKPKVVYRTRRVNGALAQSGLTAGGTHSNGKVARVYSLTEKGRDVLASPNPAKALVEATTPAPTAYCVACKAVQPMKDAGIVSVNLANGRKGSKGVCSVCGKSVFRFEKGVEQVAVIGALPSPSPSPTLADVK
jgi:hypothetical protein